MSGLFIPSYGFSDPVLMNFHTDLGSWVNITVEEFCQHRKTKKSSQWLLKNRASNCWRFVRATVEQLCQQLLKNRVSNCWTIVPVTVEQLWLRLNCRWHDCSTVAGTILQQSLARFSNSRWHDSSTIKLIFFVFWQNSSFTVEESFHKYHEYDIWSQILFAFWQGKFKLEKLIIDKLSLFSEEKCKRAKELVSWLFVIKCFCFWLTAIA